MRIDMEPTFSRETVLLVLAGMSPAVITETVWALAREGCRPQRVIVVTTSLGARCVEQGLLRPSDGSGGPTPWQQLRSALGAGANELLLDSLRIITAPDPASGRRVPLDDIRTPAANDAAADFLLESVRALVGNPDLHLIGSLAGAAARPVGTRYDHDFCSAEATIGIGIDADTGTQAPLNARLVAALVGKPVPVTGWSLGTSPPPRAACPPATSRTSARPTLSMAFRKNQQHTISVRRRLLHRPRLVLRPDFRKQMQSQQACRMKNLEQLRAAAALGPAADLDRAAISKIPAMILQNGLLAAVAFCDAEGGGGNRPHQRNAMLAVAGHLRERCITAREANGDLKSFIRDLSAKDSLVLQRATAEALAYLSYLKRFAKA